MKSQFFTTKRRPASYYAGTKNILVPSGIRLIRHGKVIGFIIHYKEEGHFETCVVNAADKLLQGEFKTFAEADQFAWLSATSI